MDDDNHNKKLFPRSTRKTVFGIKLPPIEQSESDNYKTVLDVDPEYFSMVDGRPIRPSTSINTYKQNIKDTALKRTIRGFLEDEILRIERDIETERKIYEEASNHFDDYQNSFDKFLADDNNKTIVIMQKSDALARDVANATDEQKQANFEMASIKSKLQYIEESLMILLSFENFLHKASPILWQESNKVTLDVKHAEIVTMNADIFQSYNVPLIQERLNQLIPPRLYFETPEQLLNIFNLLEKQNLNYLLVTEELNCQKNKFLKSLDTLKVMMRQDLDYIDQKIKETEDIIKWNEIREIELKEIFFRILEEKMRFLVTSETALQIYNYVEYAFEQLLAPNDTNLSSLEMAKALESEFDNLMLDLSGYDLDILKETENTTYANEIKERRQAKEASKLLKDVDKLSRRLKSSYEPSRKKIE